MVYATSFPSIYISDINIYICIVGSEKYIFLSDHKKKLDNGKAEDFLVTTNSWYLEITEPLVNSFQQGDRNVMFNSSWISYSRLH